MDELNFIKKTDQSVVISVKLVPNSSSDTVLGYNDEYLKIKITSPPNENKANKHLIIYLSKLFSIPKSNISFISGEKTKLKRLELKGTTFEKISKIILVCDRINS